MVYSRGVVILVEKCSGVIWGHNEVKPQEEPRNPNSFFLFILWGHLEEKNQLNNKKKIAWNSL